MKPTCRRRSTSTGRRGSQTPGCTAAYTSSPPRATGKSLFNITQAAMNCPTFCSSLQQLQRWFRPSWEPRLTNCLVNYVALQPFFSLITYVETLPPQRHWSITQTQFSWLKEGLEEDSQNLFAAPSGKKNCSWMQFSPQNDHNILTMCSEAYWTNFKKDKYLHSKSGLEDNCIASKWVTCFTFLSVIRGISVSRKRCEALNPRGTNLLGL